MPRAATSKRAKSGAVTSTSTISFDAPGCAQFAFAQNITPGSYNDPNPSFGSVPESSLFPSCDVPPRKVTHSRKKPEDHVPRPPNAFILFRSSFVKSDHVSSKVETNHSTLSTIIGYTWNKLPPAEKQIWFDKAKALLDEHKQKYPGYSFRPSSKNGTPYPRTKRKVREVGPKDTKRCEKIAELLVKGKKGAELDDAVSEFDHNHVPEIVTRFDAPVTARHFRRSSSAPADERPNSPFLVSLPPPAIKARAVSSQPEPSLGYSASMPSTPGYVTPSLVGEYESMGEYDPMGKYESMGEYESMSEYSTPSSPFEDTSVEYAVPAPNPEMGFESFSFNTCAAPSPVDSCDPLSSPYAEQQPDIFAPQPHVAYTMQQPVFHHPSDGLRIDTNVACEWAGPSSTPMSSSPNTPSPYPTEYMPAEATYYGGQVPGQLDELQGLPVEMFQNDGVQEQWAHPTDGYYYDPMYAQGVAAHHDPVYQKYAEVPDQVYQQEHLFAIAHSYAAHHH
ncbi:uncharacterized protein C8Q71DRAFT_761656 [Rhodofomes roseus]|uniref:HMG box domain-containing protein n=1 Tax=Rhodofomes roseus TaxID=34475 RepID=A0ABQ8KFJ8_9APHY|nr:uncharacterized protein C8Q71DRAFT_761656 [Rhodofomes roseus]KAH9836288.1 hypothetical protein C8Q71DRAFT_761656 [Rhodofomes roseus]